MYGRGFNPLLTLKALCYFDDSPNVPAAVQTRLRAAVMAVDPAKLPLLTPYVARPDEQEGRP